jgi:hypothetical protein
VEAEDRRPICDEGDVAGRGFFLGVGFSDAIPSEIRVAVDGVFDGVGGLMSCLVPQGAACGDWLGLSSYRIRMVASRGFVGQQLPLVSWEVGEGGLVQRHFWSERTILWGEVTGVRQWGKAKRTGRCLVLNYARTGPMSERGELRIKPVEFDALVRALRDHAPQAEYDLLPARG